MRSIYENYPLLANVAEIVEVEFLDLIRGEAIGKSSTVSRAS